MAEENTSLVNPMTGLTLGEQAPGIDSTSGEDLLVNPMTGQTLTGAAQVKGLTFGGKPGELAAQMQGHTWTRRTGDDLSKYQAYNVALGQDLNWDEQRARNQSTAEKWGRGLSKAGVTTLGAIAENTIGILFGLGELATGGQYYDNVVGQTVDSANEWMREHYPNYYTESEMNMTTLQKMGTANFYADTVANGLGYSLGAVATMFLTGGTGYVGMAAKGVQAVGAGSKLLGMYRLSKAITQGTKLASTLAKGAGISKSALRAGQMLDAAIMMSLAESSVEARETKRGVHDDLVQQYLEDNGLDYEWQIPDAEKVKIDKAAISAGNANFGLNMVVTSGTNALMFGKMALGFKGATKANKDVIFDAAKREVVDTLAERGVMRTALSRLKPVAIGGLEEATQEGLQFASNIYSSTLHTDKYHDGGVGDRWGAMMKGLSETFGTQEGRESMLVGFLTGGLMGGGGAAVRGEYKNRKAAAANLKAAIDAGYFDNIMAAAQAENANASYIQQMQDALSRGDHKGFKDVQMKMIFNNGLNILDQGGFDVLMEKLEDSKSMSEGEFKKMYGYTGVDSNGNTLSLADQAGGQSQAQIVDNLKGKLEQLKTTYENVNEMFPLPDKTKGLPRMRMTEAERAAEDTVYNQQQALRNELIYNGALITDRNARMESLQKDMQQVIDNDPALKNSGIDVKKAISEAFAEEDVTLSEETPSAEEYLVKRNTAIATALKNIQDQMLGPNGSAIAADKFGRQANDYIGLMSDTDRALNAYNKLVSDPFYRQAFQEEVANNERIAKEQQVQNRLDEAISNSATAADLVANSPDVNDLTPAQKQQLEDKLDALNAAEKAAADNFIQERINMSLEDRLKDLKNIDPESLSPTQRAGLTRAITETEAALNKQKEGQPIEEKVAEAINAGVAEPVEDAFKEENLGGVTAASADGREFIIDGKRFFNRRTNPLDAIERTRDGGIKTVSLFDEQGNRHVIWGPQDRVETLAYHIILSEMAKVEGQPTINREQALLEKKAAEEIIRRKATTGKHGSKTTPALRQEIYELERLFDAALQASDNLRTSYIQEAGATKEDLKNDPELKALNKEMRSLTARIREMKKVLKYRRESVTPTSNEILRAENKAMQVIEDHENQITELQSQIEVSKEKGLDAKARVESLNAASTTEKATDEWIASKRQAVKTMDTERAAIREAQERIKELQAAIAVEQQQLKRLENERSNETAGPREEAELSDAASAEREDNAREKADTRGEIEGARADVEGPVEESVTAPTDNEALKIEQAINNEPVPDNDTGQAGEQLGLFDDMDDASWEDVDPAAPTFGDALQEAAQTAVPPNEAPTGGNIGVGMANDDNVIRRKETNYKFVRIASPNGAVETNEDVLNGDATVLIPNRGLLAASPVGTEVEFQLIENDFFKESGRMSPRILADGSVSGAFDVVPIYVKINGEIVGKLEKSDGASAADRRALVKKLLSGERVTSVISQKAASPRNLNHTRVQTPTEVDAVGEQQYRYDPYFSKPTDVFQKNDEGSIILAAVSADRGVSAWVTGNEAIDADLGNHQNFENLTSGQIAVVIRPENSPDGKSKLAIASTAKLSGQAQNVVFNKLGEGNLADAAEIVANSKTADSRKNAMQNSTFLEFNQFEDGTNYIVYGSPSNKATAMVRINENELTKAIQRGGSPRFDFVQYDESADTWRKMAPAATKEFQANFSSTGIVDLYAEMDNRGGITADLRKFLEKKKYNVDIAASNANAPYVSKVTGISYDNYQDYLFGTDNNASPETGDIAGRFGHSAILTTDVTNVRGSVFNNIGVKFAKGNLKGTTVQEIVENTESPKTSSTEQEVNLEELRRLMGQGGMANTIAKNQLDQGCN